MRVLVTDDSKAMRLITARELWLSADADAVLEAESALVARDDQPDRVAFAAFHAAPAVAGTASGAGA